MSFTAGGQESPRAPVAKFYGQLRLIRSVLRAYKCPYSKLIENYILLGSACCGTFHILGITFQCLNYFVWLRITDGGSSTELRMWSIF